MVVLKRAPLFPLPPGLEKANISPQQQVAHASAIWNIRFDASAVAGIVKGMPSGRLAVVPKFRSVVKHLGQTGPVKDWKPFLKAYHYLDREGLPNFGMDGLRFLSGLTRIHDDKLVLSVDPRTLAHEPRTEKAFDKLDTQPGDFYVFPFEWGAEEMLDKSYKAVRGIILKKAEAFPLGVWEMLHLMSTYGELFKGQTVWFETMGAMLSPNGNEKYNRSTHIDLRHGVGCIGYSSDHHAFPYKYYPYGRAMLNGTSCMLV